jgi:hypothetical protein
LKPGEPATLFSIFYENRSTALNAVLYGEQLQQNPVQPVYNEGAHVAACHLHFALSSGQLGASGVLEERARSAIPKTAWQGPIERHVNPLAPDALYADLGGDHFYREVLVRRGEVLAIWSPLTPIADEASSLATRMLGIQPAPTLPPNFHRPDWNLEQVLAWLPLRDMAQVRGLEISDPERPKWYGRIHRHGYIDHMSETALREACVREELVGRSGDRETVPRGWWRERELISIGEEVWFRRDQVVALWPRHDRGNAPTGEISRSVALNVGERVDTLQSLADESKGDAKGGGYAPR